MMLRSFRLKIGLLSFSLSGLLLIGFAFFALSVLTRVGLDRIDLQLRALADAQVRQTQPTGHWPRFDDSFRSIYGEVASKQFLVLVTRPIGQALYATPKWPVDLSRDLLPLSLDGVSASVEDGPTSHASPPRAGQMDGRPPRLFEPSNSRTPPRRLPVRGPVFATLGGPNGGWRAMTVANEEVTLTIVMSLASLQAETDRFQQALLIGVPLGLLLIVAGGWFIGHMALRPVKLIARTAESVTAQRLDARITDSKVDDEFKHLIELMNAMLDRLEKSFRQATRFSADAAHELKTPLAILQAQIERSLHRAPDGSIEQREYAEQLDEAQRLRSILRKLLLLSQADAGQLPLSLEAINLADMARTAAEDMQMLAPDRKITVQSPAELVVKGDPDLLNQAIENLVSNAVKFGDTHGSISIEVGSRHDRAFLAVSNTGPLIPVRDRDKIFDRFYRADPARSRQIEGSGLGLSLAREIVRAHGGDLVLERSDETGTEFVLRIPLSCPAPNS